MDNEELDFTQYNRFCKGLCEGDILYNMDNTNLWGDYFLVSVKVPITVGKEKTWFILLLQMEKQESGFVTTTTHINLTPSKVSHTPFLKYVGHCKYTITSSIENSQVNDGLLAIYKDQDLWKYAKQTKNRKPKKKKYKEDGKPFKKD